MLSSRRSALVRVVPGGGMVDHAVLEDLDERRAAVGGGPPQDLLQMLGVGVLRARHESRLGADGHRDRIEGVVDRSQWGRLAAVSEEGGGRVLPLGETVHLVVEEHDLDVHVAPDAVQQVVAADGEAVAVAGDDPHGQVGVHRLQPRGDGGRPPVDGVDAVGVHVVREAARAADARDEDDLLPGDADLRKDLLHLREDGIVAAAGAPPHLLVGDEVLARQLRFNGLVHLLGSAGFVSRGWSGSCRISHGF